MDESDRQTRLGRRLLVLRVATLGATGTAAASVTAEAASGLPQPGAPGGTEPVRTDNDPHDAAGHGRGYRGNSGRTDNDPSDGVGSGRGGYRGNTGRTDNDPRDGAGQGRGGYATPQARGVTDNDPSDGPGRGRGHAPRRTVTDNDPSDGAGRGRGWR
ncbi:hypothetical protein GCM10011504_00800 [Siccirubricoccus deserti]|uniref:Uncharacterized protein n=1 Tax=Siccirubricoccus deserti TaxID=2013562 RepID=A0A9X0QVD8_9PROT|nr:hypothetical protein [Siccirubricoccus deserti]MBC4014092.1 hypothetical protein [Siccirubricoccus deserti]GGC26353.1 hypothetical protein GCM10011504_00800 [Siccirubricoccus deserti]